MDKYERKQNQNNFWHLIWQLMFFITWVLGFIDWHWSIVFIPTWIAFADSLAVALEEKKEKDN